MSDRGMKKWAPYRSLPEKDIFDNKMKKKREEIKKPQISNEEAEEINYLLINHNNKELVFTVFNNGKMQTIIGKIKKIDIINKTIYLLAGEKISLINIIRVKNN